MNLTANDLIYIIGEQEVMLRQLRLQIARLEQELSDLKKASTEV